jgi:hypothetical protein
MFEIAYVLLEVNEKFSCSAEEKAILLVCGWDGAQLCS